MNKMEISEEIGQERIIRKVSVIGNGGHIFAPKEWVGEEVVLMRMPKLGIKQEIIKILLPYLHNLSGIYLIGSHARKEATERSDIDVLAITDRINKRILHGKYDILLVSIENLEKQLKTNILPLLPMIMEAEPLLNAALIEKYKKTLLTKENLSFHVETTKSALAMNREFIKLAELDKENLSDTVAYSLILRLREIYIVNCLIKKKSWDNKTFLSLIKQISGSLKAYEGYLRVKDNKKNKNELPINEAEKIYDYILKRIKEQEKWARKRR